MDLLIVKMFIFLQLIMIISQQSRADQRNLGLSTLTGLSSPANLIGAVKIASDASKLINGDSKGIANTLNKAMENYSPIVLPQSSSGESTIDAIQLDDRQLKLYLTAERAEHLIKMAGLNSKNIDWKLYRFPLSLNQLKTILSAHKGSSRLSIMSMDSYIPKIMSNLDRFQDSYYRLFEKSIESEMDLDEFLEYIDQLDQVNEGMVILPVEIKSGALQKPPGSIVLLGLGKFPADRKQLEPPSIVPTILIGQVRQISPLQYETDPIVTPTATPETVVMEAPKNEPEISTILEVVESPLPGANIPIEDTSSTANSGGGDTFNNPVMIGSDKVFSSSQSSAQATFFSSGPQASINHQPLRPMQRPFPPHQQQQARPNLRPPSFDGRPSQPQFQHQPNLRPMPKPRMDIQG